MAAEEPAAEPAEELAHAEVLELFQAALARLVQDPLLCDLPPQVRPRRGGRAGPAGLGSRPCRSPAGDGGGDRLAGGSGVRAGHDAVVVVQNASVLELKKALRRHFQLRQARQGGVQHLSWKYIWRTYHLTFNGEKLADDRKKLREYGIRNRDEVSFIKKLRK
ncbi:U11/U12 small nuclear ribonucleoprotein 25 kDa protein isoform X1 [Passer montanus]|uniref:U11/U12 small nuclear ribonucleoprotein 25 kDa protein isoform X1 n=1 Tax=Passer montanus TaxID=9160 RepID=UPI0019622439|nr:U11/U12 small nuclear ribonucleoprotein 25 kDa protein isoform X1 [Passer montanus]